MEIALPYKQKLCELTEVVMQDIGLQNIELPGNKEFLEKFILAYTIFCKETVNLIIDDAQP